MARYEHKTGASETRTTIATIASIGLSTVGLALERSSFNLYGLRAIVSDANTRLELASDGQAIVNENSFTCDHPKGPTIRLIRVPSDEALWGRARAVHLYIDAVLQSCSDAQVL